MTEQDRSMITLLAQNTLALAQSKCVNNAAWDHATLWNTVAAQGLIWCQKPSQSKGCWPRPGKAHTGAVIIQGKVTIWPSDSVSHWSFVLQRNCGKSPSCGWRINFIYDYIALLFCVSVFPVLEWEPCKAVMRKACHASDAWREKKGKVMEIFFMKKWRES